MYNTVKMKGGKECENGMIIYVHNTQNKLRSHNTYTHALYIKIHCMCETIYDRRKVPIHMYRYYEPHLLQQNTSHVQ